MIRLPQEGRLVGYARVSTEQQDLALQIDALTTLGIPSNLIFVDKISGARRERPGLEACLIELEAGDTLVVWRLDRLGRSMAHLVTLIQELQDRSVGFRSVCDGAIDTTTPSGELIFHVFSALDQFERRLIQERTKAGLAAARARGKVGGRKPLDPNEPRVVLANKLFKDRTNTINDICSTLKISKSTLYRYVAIGNGKVNAQSKRR